MGRERVGKTTKQCEGEKKRLLVFPVLFKRYRYCKTKTEKRQTKAILAAKITGM